MKRSNTEIRRLIKQGAIDICGEKFVPPSAIIHIPMRVGKKEFIDIGVEINEQDIIKVLSEYDS